MKQKNKGVSPFIGVLLMVLIAIIISAVVSSFVIDISEQIDNYNQGDYDIELNKNHISYEQSDFKTYRLTYHIDCNGNGEIDVAESITKLSSLTISDLSEACTDDQQSFDIEDYYVWTDTAFNEGDKV